MSSPATSTIADVGDRHRRRMATALLLLGLMFGVLAVRGWLQPGTTGALVLGFTVVGFLLLALGAMVPMFLWKARNLWGKGYAARSLYRGEDGVVAETLSRAHIASWMSTFLFLALASGLEDTLAAAPPVFMVHVTLTVLLVSFGLSFLVFDRDAGVDDDGEVQAGA